MDHAPTQDQQDSAQEAKRLVSGPTEELPERVESRQPAVNGQPPGNLALAGKELVGTQLAMDVNMRKQDSECICPEAQAVDALPNTTPTISLVQSEPNDLGDQLPEVSAETPNLSEPKAWDESHEYVYMPKPKLDPWETIKQGFDKYDKEMCDAWNDELNTILTFTGLFSAAVTAFCIESFQSLSQNPADTTNTFLMVISQQIANPSSPVANLSVVDAFVPQASDVQINVLYFISLTLALSVSSICILAKQWIREYQKDISVSPRDATRVRQARFDSFEAWRVPQIIGILPVILLAALMMFFSGLLIQLWNVSDQATAQAVSVIATLTILLVVATTIIPALVGGQRDLSCFAPFRSPQAWIFLYVYRHLHRIIGYYPIVYSWADCDQTFLKREVRYGNVVTSAHRMLHWAVEVLRNSSEIEKALLLCLLPKYHPYDLIMDETELGRYVLYNINEGETTGNLHHIYYHYYRTNSNRRRQGLDSLVGRHEIELLIRSAHRATIGGHDLEQMWDEIQYSCNNLYNGYLFVSYKADDIVNHQHVLQNQVALLLEKIFTLPPPSHSVEWYFIVALLLARHSSPLSRQITLDLATIQIPAWIRKHTSVCLSSGIGRAIISSLRWRTYTLRIASPLFTHLDKIMVEWCNEPKGIVDGLDEKSVEQWRRLRLEFTRCISNPEMRGEAEYLQLHDDYFDNLPGHGPLILTAVPSPEL